MVTGGFATREAENVASSLESQLEGEDIKPLALIALSAAGGVIIAQEIADRVLPMLGFSATPTDATGFAVSGALKFALALAAGALAGSFSGAGLIVVAYAAVGHLASAGADFVNAVQRTGLVAESRFEAAPVTHGGGSGNANAPSPNRGGGRSYRSTV